MDWELENENVDRYKVEWLEKESWVRKLRGKMEWEWEMKVKEKVGW